MVKTTKYKHSTRIKTLSSLLAIATCFLGRTCIPAQVDTNRDPAHISIYVSPFYNSEGPSITVGPFSDGLGATDQSCFIAAIREMKRDQSRLAFPEMYVAAIRLYELGYRNESIYWFYSADYQGRLFTALLDEKKAGSIGDAGFELLHANKAFQTLVGPYINSYAFADTEYLGRVIRRVKESAQRVPDMKAVYGDLFKDEPEWPLQNRVVAEGLEKLSAAILDQKDEITRKRVDSGVQAQFSRLTNKQFPDLPEKDAALIGGYLKHLREFESERDLGQQDREALVKLGCFKHADFHLTLRFMTTNNAAELVQMVTNSTFINDNYALMINLTNARVLGITAHCADIPTWQKLVSRFDSAKAK